MAARRPPSSRLTEHPVLFALVGIALAGSCVLNGWSGDDFFIRRRIAEWDLPRVLMDLFVLPGGEPSEQRAAIEGAGFPWWADPELRVSFWRPLSAITHVVDAYLWPDSSVWAHVHSLLWLGLFCALVALLYRRLWGATIAAALAAACFAADDSRGVTIGWVASRNALIAGALGVAALLQHHRWRREGARWAAVGAPVTLALALLAGESAVGALAYLVAWAVCLDDARPRERVASLVPYVVLVVGWRTLYQHLGYGTVGSALYSDPGREPVRFVLGVLQNGPVLLLRQLGVRFAEAYPVMTAGQRLEILLLAVLFLGIVVLAMLPMLRRDRTARFLGLGMVLAVLPACAAVPQGRLLTFVGIGAAGLLGRWVEWLWWRRPRWLPATDVWRVPAHTVTALLLVSGTLVAPLTMRWMLWEVAAFYPDLERHVLSLPERDCASDGKVILVQGGLPVGFFYSDLRALEGLTPPKRFLVLAPDAVVRVTRIDERTLAIRPHGGYLAPSDTDDWYLNATRMFERYVRVEDRPLALGERVELEGLTIEITRLNGHGRPAEATFRFAVPLEDRSLRWFARHGTRYERFALPAVGESVLLASRRA